MTTTHPPDTEMAVLDDLRSTRDLLSVRRVFGDPYTVDGATIIPVARVAGGGGGGGGEGTGPDESGGHGFGTGFGLGARPVGVYRISDGDVSPARRSFTATRRFGCSCSASKTTPIPPSPTLRITR